MNGLPIFLGDGRRNANLAAAIHFRASCKMPRTGMNRHRRRGQTVGMLKRIQTCSAVGGSSKGSSLAVPSMRATDTMR